MENKIKGSPLAVSLLLLATTFAVAVFGVAALLSTTTQVISADASISTDTTETNESITPTSKNNNNNNTINLAEKPFLVEHGRTVGAIPINQTHMQISLAGNGTITLPNSTETVMTKDTGNAIARLTPTGNIAYGQINIGTEDGGSENATVFFTEIGQNQKGVGVAYFSTNSTGKLAFLDNMAAVFQDEMQPDGSTVITAWEWRGE
jgi:hypothetical protein